MKAKFFIPVLWLSFIVAGCQWRMPEKVTVKQNATYKFSAGTIEPDLGVKFDFKSIVENMVSSQEESKIQFYDYNPGGESKTQQFMVRMPIAEIPIDFNNFLENSGLNSAVKGLSFNQTIKIPKINMDVDYEIDLKKAVNATLVYVYAAAGFANKFSFAEFNQNSTLKCENMIFPQGVNISEIVISSAGFTKSGYVDSSNNVAVIDISNFKIVCDDFKIEFVGDNEQKYPFTGIARVTEDSNTKIVSGLNAKSIAVPVEINFSASGGKNSSFEECEIGNGFLATDIKMPATWNGVTVSYDFATNGAMNIDKTSEKNISLENKTIKSGNTKATVNVDISLSAATIDFEKPLKMIIKSDIKTLSQIAINLDDFNGSINKQEPLPDEMKKSVKKIVLNQSGLNLIYTNALPVGNEITLSACSDFLGLDAKNEILESGKTDEKKSILSPVAQKTVKITDATSASSSEYDSYDFKVDVLLPGATPENQNRVTLKNVGLGDEYNIAMRVEPVINWEEITLSDNLATSLSQKDKIKLPFDLNNIFNSDSLGDYYGDLAKKLEIKSLPIYIFCTKPEVKADSRDPFSNAKFNGNISLYYGKQQNDGTVIKAGAEEKLTENNAIPFVQKNLDIEFDEKAPDVLITDYSKYTQENYSATKDIANLINNKQTEEGGSIFVDYDLSFSNGSDSGEIKIQKSALAGSGSIGVSAVLILPLEFKVTEQYDLDMKKFAGDAFTKDIFGRADANAEILGGNAKHIGSMALNYECSKLPFSGDNLKLDITIGNADITKDATLKKGRVEITSDDLKYNMQYPAIPNIKLTMNKDAVISLPRETGFAVKIALEIETDCEIPVLGGKK